MTTATTVETAVFTCSICGEPSRDICIICTKDACANHRCERCKRCSDCCECEVPLSAAEVQEAEQARVPVDTPSADGQAQSAAAAQAPETATQPPPPVESAPTATEPLTTVDPTPDLDLPEAMPEASGSSAPEHPGDPGQ